MSIKVTPENYPEIIEVYNSEGKTAAYDLIRSQYGIKNPTCVMKRMKQSNELSYNPDKDRFEITSCHEEEGIFLDLEDLCKRNANDSEKTTDISLKDSRAQAMERLVHSLISDRLLELSKYVLLDPLNHHVIIDRTAMVTDGYQVRIH